MGGRKKRKAYLFLDMCVEQSPRQSPDGTTSADPHSTPEPPPLPRLCAASPAGLLWVERQVVVASVASRHDGVRLITSTRHGGQARPKSA